MSAQDSYSTDMKGDSRFRENHLKSGPAPRSSEVQQRQVRYESQVSTAMPLSNPMSSAMKDVLSDSDYKSVQQSNLTNVEKMAGMVSHTKNCTIPDTIIL